MRSLGNLWVAEDGSRVFTRGGSTFRTSDTQSQDMIYAGSLDGTRPPHVDHHAATGRIVAGPAGSGWNGAPPSLVRRFDDEYLGHVGDKYLPMALVGSREYALIPRMAFFDGSGDRVFVLADSDPVSGVLEDYLVRFDLASP